MYYVPQQPRLLQHYGIEVRHANPYGYRTKKLGPKALLPLAEKLLGQSTDEYWTKSVMYERVLLLCHGSHEHADAPGRDLVDGVLADLSRFEGIRQLWQRAA